MGQLSSPPAASGTSGAVVLAPERIRALQRVGVLCGIAAGAWLGAAEVPTKLVTTGISPVLISFVMVAGVFLGRWSLPAIVRGTSGIRADIVEAPHLVIWAIIAGCLWSVANTLTIFAIRDLGLSIAFPLWNANALIGILWGVLFFRELHRAGWRRWSAVCGGALVMFLGGMLLARASSSQIASHVAVRGIAAALGAGVLWGTMYIPYRKAYLSGMNPLSFVSFFTIGELGMMTALAVAYMGGFRSLYRQIAGAEDVLFWLLAAGFVWVIGDIFQQYAVKYIGVSRGIPISNSNQLWGLLWGAVAFGEFRGWQHGAVAGAIWGSVLMALGLAAISFSGADNSEYLKWMEAAEREHRRYGIDIEFVRSGLQGRTTVPPRRRTWLDWLLVAMATGVFVWAGARAHWPSIVLDGVSAIVLLALCLALLGACVAALWKVTRFN
ncbi:MAG TPA: GRP family sugar transporter [Terriglobales bacterium]|nr:GRP family sugar transporter [Terriglobales bacterium]